MRVRIVEDCRPDHTATGLLGTIVGQGHPEDCSIVTPKIMLDNGDVIYGIECWWEEYTESSPPLEEVQRDLETHKATVRAAILENSHDA